MGLMTGFHQPTCLFMLLCLCLDGTSRSQAASMSTTCSQDYSEYPECQGFAPLPPYCYCYCFTPSKTRVSQERISSLPPAKAQTCAVPHYLEGGGLEGSNSPALRRATTHLPSLWCIVAHPPCRNILFVSHDLLCYASCLHVANLIC